MGRDPPVPTSRMDASPRRWPRSPTSWRSRASRPSRWAPTGVPPSRWPSAPSTWRVPSGPARSPSFRGGRQHRRAAPRAWFERAAAPTTRSSARSCPPRCARCWPSPASGRTPCARVWEQLGVATLAELEMAAREGRLRGVRGISATDGGAHPGRHRRAGGTSPAADAPQRGPGPRGPGRGAGRGPAGRSLGHAPAGRCVAGVTRSETWTSSWRPRGRSVSWRP